MERTTRVKQDEEGAFEFCPCEELDVRGFACPPWGSEPLGAPHMTHLAEAAGDMSPTLFEGDRRRGAPPG